MIFSGHLKWKKWHYGKKEHPFASKNHYHLYIFGNSYPNYDKTWNPPITLLGEYFKNFWIKSFITLSSFFLGQNNPILQSTIKSESGWCHPLGDITEFCPPHQKKKIYIYIYIHIYLYIFIYIYIHCVHWLYANQL